MDEEGGEGIGVRRNELCRLQSMHEAPCCTKSPERGRQTGALVMVREEKGGTVRVLVVIVVVATHNHVALRWRRRGGGGGRGRGVGVVFCGGVGQSKVVVSLIKFLGLKILKAGCAGLN